MNKDNVSIVASNLKGITVGTVALLLMALGAPNLASAAELSRQLEVGMSGADVSALQTFLAQDSTIYPQGLVTGYFGVLTSAAVSNFQSRNGIDNVGRVGPITLAKLNSQMVGGVVGNTGADVYAPTITNVAVSRSGNTATISWYTAEAARGKVHYSPSPLTVYEYPHTVDVSGLTAMTDGMVRNTQSVVIGGLMASTTYHYLIHASDAAGNVSITLPTTFQSM